MNTSLSRLLVSLPFSIVLSLGLVLLTWSVNDANYSGTMFNAGLMYTVTVFSLMCIISIRKIILSESHDYSQNKLDLILEAVLMDSKKKQVNEETSIEDVEFDYTQIPTQRIPSPQVDKSLQF